MGCSNVFLLKSRGAKYCSPECASGQKDIDEEVVKSLSVNQLVKKVGIGRDRAKRLKSELESKEQQKLLRTLSSASNDPSVITDPATLNEIFSQTTEGITFGGGYGTLEAEIKR